MYEDKTYEAIMEEALNRVKSDVDKREGSVIYDAIGPCAYHLAQLYFELSNFIDLVMLDTAAGDYLDRKASEFGVTRKPATAAVRSISTSAEVTIGSRWELDKIVYRVEAKMSDTSYAATCETTGSVGNTGIGELISRSDITGITATLGGIITPGADEEEDEALRERILESVRKPSTSGNIADYKAWAKSVAGVGDARVFPLWNGPGTVKVIIVDDNKGINTTLEDDVAAYIEDHRPIGANVTVSSPEAKVINVSAGVVLLSNCSIDDAVNNFKASLRRYLNGLVFVSSKVSYAKIGALLLDSAGIADYSDLTVNDDTASIIISDNEIPTIGVVTLTEVES